MRLTHLSSWLLVLASGLACCCGCGRAPGGPDPRFATERALYLLSAEPSGALPVLDAREELSCDGAVTLVGQVGGATEPLSPHKASFVIADPTLADDGHDGHECGDNCPFCKRKQENQAHGLALVEIVDPDGKVVPIGAAALFGLEVDQTVVVQGRAEVDSLGNLVVKAPGLYIRR